MFEQDPSDGVGNRVWVPELMTGDMAQDVGVAVARLRGQAPTAHVVAFMSWALTYVGRAHP